MKELLGLLLLYLRLKRMGYGALIIVRDMDTNQTYWVLSRNVGTTKVTYTGHVRQLDKYLTRWR